MKAGVVSRGAFADAALEREHGKRGWWPFAYTLLGDIEQSYTARDEALLERLYSSMRAGDGVYKITKRERFGELDAIMAEEIARRFEAAQVVRVHDMAASNAITSLELFQRLGSDVRVSVRASDFFDAIYVVSFEDTAWRIVLDVMGRPLQFVGPRLVLSAYRREPLRYPVNRLAQQVVGARLFQRLAGVDVAAGYAPDGAKLRRIGLIHPVCVATARTEPRFSLGREDLFAPRRVPYEVVRVMNALTTHHFSRDQVLAAVAAVAETLVDGGLLVLGRSVDEADGRVRATIFQKSGGRLRGVRDIGEGDELRAAVLGLDRCG